MSQGRIVVTYNDYLVLTKLADALRCSDRQYKPHCARFIEEMRSAAVSDPVPAGVVTLRSGVAYTYIGTGQTGHAVIVFPADVIDGKDTVSILSPFGMALIGEREGTVVEYTAPGGSFRIRIDRVEQPSAA